MRLNEVIITDIINAVTIASERGRFINMEDRVSYGLSFCIEGQITYTHNGKKFISNKSNAVILPQGQSYTLSGDKSGYFPLINFHTKQKLCDTFMVIPIEDAKLFINDYERKKALSLFEGNNAKIMSIFYGMLDRLESDGKPESKLKPAIDYIRKNPGNPCITNRLLANECNISEVYLRKLFAAEFKTSPRQFIIDTRIQKAKQLLSEGVLKINAVSDKCGFSSPYHFCRTFRGKTGLTPSEYASANRNYKI